MARGRMLNKKISRDREVAELVNDLGGDAGLFYTWLIAHLDREGRIDADPEVLKGLIVPRISRISAAKIPPIIRKASAINLVEIYEDSRGGRFIVFPKFKQNQIGMRYDREPASEFPDPEKCRQKSGIDPEGIRKVSGRYPAERKGKEEKVKEEKTKKYMSSSVPDLDGSISVKDIWAHYRRWHPRTPLKISDKNRKLTVARIKEGFSPDDIKQAIDGYHRSPFHTGQNDQGTKYLAYPLILRDQDHVQKGIEFSSDPRLGQRQDSLTEKNARAVQQWLEMKGNQDDN